MYSTPQLPNYIRTPCFPRKNPERVNHPRGVVKGGLCTDLYTVYTGGEGSKVIDQSHTGSGEAVRNYFRCFFFNYSRQREWPGARGWTDFEFDS